MKKYLTQNNKCYLCLGARVVVKLNIHDHGGGGLGHVGSDSYGELHTITLLAKPELPGMKECRGYSIVSI